MASRPYVFRLVLTVLALGSAACKPPPPAIALRDDTLTIHNRTTEEWRNVRVLVNHHFGGGTASLPAGGRLDAPLSRFETGHGQKFDRRRQSVFRVEVTAATAGGQPVRLLWPEDADDQKADDQKK